MKKVGYIAFGVFLSLFMLLTAIDLISFNMNHYLNQYEKNNIVSQVGIDEMNLEYITNTILSYLSDDVDNLNIEALWNNEMRSVFSEREIEHMEDVKHLFIEGRRIRLFSGLILIGLIITIVKWDYKWKENMSKALVATGLANYAILALLLSGMKYDFTKYFNYFHYIFFDNDLWILDPTTEILVQILPEQFFYNTALKIALLFFIPMTMLGLSSSYYLFFRKRFQ